MIVWETVILLSLARMVGFVAPAAGKGAELSSLRTNFKVSIVEKNDIF